VSIREHTLDLNIQLNFKRRGDKPISQKSRQPFKKKKEEKGRKRNFNSISKKGEAVKQAERKLTYARTRMLTYADVC
jgi:hypothetical protein